MEKVGVKTRHYNYGIREACSKSTIAKRFVMSTARLLGQIRSNNGTSNEHNRELTIE